MRRLRERPLAAKVQIVLVLTTTLLLLATAGFHAGRELLSFREVQVEHLLSLARVVGSNSQAALAFGDRDLAADVLGALQAEPTVDYAEIVLPDGSTFVSYGSLDAGFARLRDAAATEAIGAPAPAGGDAPVVRRDFTSTILAADIRLDGELLGAALLHASTVPLYRRLAWQGALTLALVLGAVIVSLFVASWSRRLITEPLERLSRTMEEVAERQNFDVELEAQGSDEVVRLIQVFNAMIEQIHQRDVNLAEHRRHLEEEVQTRTEALSLANAELRTTTEEALQARAVAESANRAKSEFLANMSHEIRTPINGMLGNTELLMNAPLDADAKRYAETAYRSGEALLSVVNDILDFSKIEAGKLSLEHVPFDLRGLIEDVVSTFADPAQRKGLEIMCDMPPGLPSRYVGDPARLRQVMNNLVGNAVKFTERGEVLVRVRSVAEGAVDRVHFEVRDTGIGISEAAQEGIFESFSQADSSTTRMYGGTGLGLAISRRLVELMGGDIQVHSAPGEGACFSFAVQLSPGEGIEAWLREAISRLEGRRMLVAEDNETNRELLRHHLVAMGVDVTTAVDGRAALDALHAAANEGVLFDLVLTDNRMPGLTGPELAAAIANEPALGRPPVLLISSLVEAAGGDPAARTGIAAQALKPLREQELCFHMLRALGQEAAPARPDRLPGAPGTERGAASGGARVLVVDDNAINQDMLANMLRALGCEVTVVANGREGVKRAIGETFDIVLMDCQMPVMDGYEATRRIREHERAMAGGRVPVVAVTANAMKGDRERCLEAGMDDYLAKPFRQATLEEVLRKWSETAHERSGERSAPVRKGGAAQGVPHAGLLDRSALDNVRAMQQPGQPPLLDRFIDLFLSQTPDAIDALAVAAAAPDYAALARLAHSLKSDCLNLGARNLAELARALEELGRSQASGDAAAMVDEIRAGFAAVAAALQREKEHAA